MKTFRQTHGQSLFIKVELLNEVENIVAKGEIARFKSRLLQQRICMWEIVNFKSSLYMSSVCKNHEINEHLLVLKEIRPRYSFIRELQTGGLLSLVQ